MKKVLVLFPNNWDISEFSKEKYTDKYIFVYEGIDFFKFPSYLQLPFFSTRRFIKRIIKKAQLLKVDAVLSSDEYLGAIIAAIVTQKLGLPGTKSEKIILAQHKYFSRLIQQKHCSEASVNCELIPQKIPKNYHNQLAFPFFVKPTKGTFSLFAKKVNNFEDLKSHLNFNWYEQILFGLITRPFNELLCDYSNLKENANFFIGEELIEGVQVTVDGFISNNEVTICGVVDSIMFPGTNIFERFEYPSKLSMDIQQRMNHIVESLIHGFGFQNAQFNVEFFYNQKDNSIHIIEINPRLSYQFADLYENVDGKNTYQILLDLALGQKPTFEKDSGEFSCSASFVLRTFKGKKIKTIPEARDIEEFKDRYVESNIKVYGKKGTKLSNEMRAIGSYRYGIVNVGAHSLLDLFSVYEDLLESLPFTFK